jgi:serine/threonine protein kinase
VASEWNQLRDLFEGALERPPHERAAFLLERTNGNESLRREIESLLIAHEAAGPFLNDPPPASSQTDGRATDVAPPRLAAGARFGAFTIVELIGSGGMGEVYRARDTRLDRFVAIKVLSAEVDVAVRGRERFEREARAISRLSHPRICTVHDIGVAQVDGWDVPYLVMELLDGETLATEVARGPLSIQQSLTYAVDIADALVAAHSQGIVHRDLKPANVMVTSTGVKLLDFGLAQLRSPEGSSVVAHGSHDGSFTSAGLVFGTLPYMSPEQLRGEKVDARTDVFALGAVLHEMLTGRRPFAADSQAELIAAILERDTTPVSDLQPLASDDLDRVVHKCLAKNPDDRWQTARDLKSELAWVRDNRKDPPRSRRSVADPARRRSLMPLLVGATAVVAGVIATTAWRYASTPSASRTPSHLSLTFPPGVRLYTPTNGISFDISPDGTRIAYVGVRDGVRSLFVHTLNSGKTVEVPDSRDTGTPMFSPDSQRLAFGQNPVLRMLPAGGGPIQTVPGITASGQMTWAADNRFLTGGASRPIRTTTGDDAFITKMEPGDEAHGTPVMLPDGSLLFTALRGGWLSARNTIRALTSGGHEVRDLVSNATTPQLVGTDAIVFAQGRRLVASGFDTPSVRLVGEPRALDVEVQTTRLSLAPMYAVARNGTLVYAPFTGGRRLVWIDRQGREEFLKIEPRMFAQLRISPDGRRVAVNRGDEDRDIWVYALDGSSSYKLTAGPDPDAMPVWSRDGSHVFFTRAQRNVSRIPADGSRPPETLLSLPSPQRIHPTSISSDGKRLLTHWDLQPKEIDLRVVELGSTPTLTPLVRDSGFASDGSLSPDGRWIAYVSAETREVDQIVVRPFPDVQAGKFVISTGIGRQPMWSRDGKELFYRTEDGTVMSVSIRSGPVFAHGSPVPVVTPADVIRDVGSSPSYDVSVDGRRFLFIKAPEMDIRSLNVVLNWDLEVRAALGRDN